MKTKGHYVKTIARHYGTYFWRKGVRIVAMGVSKSLQTPDRKWFTLDADA